MTWALAFGIVGIVWLKSAIENRSVQDVLRGVFTSNGPGPGPAGFQQHDLLGGLIGAPAGGGGSSSVATPNGIGTFDGKPVCNWLIPILKKARESGLWSGSVISGYRDNAAQAAACAQTTGPCAEPGQSNHQGTRFPSCAVDVSDPAGFARAMEAQGNPLKALVANDANHFSHDGH